MNTKILKDANYMPIVDGEHIYINPSVLTFKAVVDVKIGKATSIDKALNLYTYDDGETPLTETLKTAVAKDAYTILNNFYSRQYNEREADALINKVVGKYDILGMMSKKAVERTDYNISYNVYDFGYLYDSVRAGTKNTNRGNMPAKIAKYGRLKRFMQRWELLDTELEEMLYNKNQFLAEISEAKLEEWFTRLNYIATVGDYTASSPDTYSNTDPDTYLADGIETILKEYTGAFQNRDGVNYNGKMFKKYIKPDVIDFGKVVGAYSANLSGFNGYKVAQVFDAILKRVATNHRLKKMFGNSKTNAFYVDPATFFTYSESRIYNGSSATGFLNSAPTAFQEEKLQNGYNGIRHKGYAIIPLVDASGTTIIFGDMSQYQMIYQYGMVEQANYEMELANGDSGWQFKRKGHMIFDVADASRFIIATTGSAAYRKASVPELQVGGYGLSVAVTASGTELAEATAGYDIYAYTTELDSVMYYTTDGSTPDNTKTVLTEGTAVHIDNGETLKIVAIKDNLATSDTVSISVASGD